MFGFALHSKKLFIELVFGDTTNVLINLDTGTVLNKLKRKCSEKEPVFRL